MLIRLEKIKAIRLKRDICMIRSKIYQKRNYFSKTRKITQLSYDNSSKSYPIFLVLYLNEGSEKENTSMLLTSENILHFTNEILHFFVVRHVYTCDAKNVHIKYNCNHCKSDNFGSKMKSFEHVYIRLTHDSSSSSSNSSSSGGYYRMRMLI